ncbi:hypothetical protein KR026_009129 [Drosophila bipectinata]|nr:hypothetical protein KR026_009129 [Drosophila bipectinata]
MWRSCAAPIVELVLLIFFLGDVYSLICTRRPSNTATPKSPVDENYVISVSGNPETYILGQEYNVSLNAFNGHRYISFILALENENGDYNYNDDLGRFELSDTIETRFSPNCINMVENTNTNPKTHMHLTWVAPTNPESGCVLIRATVLQHRDVWHMDDGGLTRRICPDTTDDVESQPSAPSAEAPCCACDEARYELIFEGVWSRNLHPRDFPARSWETRFCELVGAAHSADYRFWEAGALANEAMKQYAEHCSSRLLEREFSNNFKDQKIRTIIKARGPSFPNINSKTSASVRVDPLHHMISFASKIEPSPDWIVGISGLELCLRNCTWLDEKVIQLYPWDVGTDAGPTYTSPDQPQVPPDVIRRMRSDFPNDPRSPFYDENGDPMKPMAYLTIKRQRIYERRCADEDSNNDADVPRECLTHPWSGWSDCSSKCGAGMQYRRRVYKQPELAKIYNCNVPQYEERECEGEMCGQNSIMRNIDPQIDPELDPDQGFGRNVYQSPQQGRAECQLGSWSIWGPCSGSCGSGYETRQRQYLNPQSEAKCQSVHRARLQESRPCSGRVCLGNLPGSYNGDEENPYGEISPGRGGSNMYAPQPEREAESFADYDEARVDQSRGLGGFEVGNLKGSSGSWGINRPLERQTNLGRNAQPYHNQPARLERPSWQRLDDSRLENMERSAWQTSSSQDDHIQDIQEQTPWQTNAGNVEKDNWRGQSPANSYKRKYGERFDTSEEDLQRDPWSRQKTHSPQDLHTSGGGGLDTSLVNKCFQMLQTEQSRCFNQTIIGNFWFYNFCADECMLFATDTCDRNVNKFSRWEECQKCRLPELSSLQQQYSELPECQNLRESLEADTRSREEQRGKNRRRNYNNYRQSGRNKVNNY